MRDFWPEQNLAEVGTAAGSGLRSKPSSAIGMESATWSPRRPMGRNAGMSRKPSAAPGLDWKNGRPRWRARKKAVQLGYSPSVISLDLDPDDRSAIAQRCREEWAKMELWLAGEFAPPRRFDGTLGSLIELYSADADSPYQDLKYNSQRSYDDNLKVLKKTVGARRVDKLTGEDFRRWYRKLREPRKPGSEPRIARAHNCMTMLRILFGYGITLGLPNCGTLKQVLSEMRFKDAAPREEFITLDQVVAFIAKAHELGRPELALGQALQYDGMLRQIDIIGEWVPDPERPSGTRWANGLLWQHIRDYVLIKDTTKTGQQAAVDFKLYPLALAELQRVPLDERLGPVIKDGRTGLPFRRNMYARRWRAVAGAAGIPQNVMNRDSRAGGVTEGSDAGAGLELLRHHASHSSTSTTARYSRKTLAKTSEVARLRMAHREGRK
jgi:hypothetical protein